MMANINPARDSAPSDLPGRYSGFQQYGSYQDRPPDYRIWAAIAAAAGILFSLLIGTPMALAAIRNSRRVRSRWADGDQLGAVSASGRARNWAIAATAFDVLGLVLVIILFSRAGHPAN